MKPKKYDEVQYIAVKNSITKGVKITIILTSLVGILGLIISFMGLDISIKYEALKRENIELNKVIDMKDSIIADLQEDNMKLQEMIK